MGDREIEKSGVLYAELSGLSLRAQINDRSRLAYIDLREQTYKKKTINKAKT